MGFTTKFFAGFPAASGLLGYYFERIFKRLSAFDDYKL